jgi:hypothetical protein
VLYIKFMPENLAHVENFYALSLHIAELLEPVFGTVRSDWDREDSDEILAYRRPGGLTKPQFSQGGPAGFATRTWFGADLVGLIGKNELQKLEKPLGWTNYGGCSVDLVPDVTKTDLETLMEEQKRLTAAFSHLEIFGDYTKFYNAKPGAAWSQLKKEKSLF